MASVGVVVLAGAGTYGWYWFKTGRFLESTDDAYVKADYTTIAPKVSGYIAEVAVEDNQSVKAGQVLARIDDRDYRTALAQAKADVASAEADIRNIEAQLAEQQSVIAQAEAAIVSDQAAVKFAQDDYDRYRKLTAGRITSVQDEQRAQTVLQQQSARAAERPRRPDRRAPAGRGAEHRARQGGDPGDAPAVRASTRRELNLSYTTITAPIDGTVGARSLRVGQYVQAGTQLMAVVPLHAVYVVANFKETQLTNVAAGQPVEIEVDSLPRPCREGPCRQPVAGQRPRVRAAAAGQRHRQLHQDRPAHPGEDRRSSQRRARRPSARRHVGRAGDRHPHLRRGGHAPATGADNVAIR